MYTITIFILEQPRDMFRAKFEDYQTFFSCSNTKIVVETYV